MIKTIAKVISVIFHPLFMVFYMLLFLMAAVPEIFISSDPRKKTFIILSFLALTITFPLVGVAMMKFQGMISGFEMKDKKDRIGPLILTGIFYLWLYVNIRSNTAIPDSIIFFTLGTIIALFMGLFLNSFTKISLHSIGIGGFLAGIFFMKFNFTYPTFDIFIPYIELAYRISVDFVVYVSILVAGFIGTARLYLNSHNKDELYGGYLVGMVSQIIAFRLYF